MLWGSRRRAPNTTRARRLTGRERSSAANISASRDAALHAGGVRGWLLGRTIPALWVRLRRGARDVAADASRSGAVARRFWSLWLDVAGALPAFALRRLFHASAAALAVGAVAGMFVRGVFFDYAMVWRSTFIRDPESAAQALRVVLGPAALALGWPLPDAADATQMMDAVGVPAAPWIGLWAMTALLFVVLPRTLLASFATLRARRLARNVALPLDDAYFETLLAGVRKVQIERIESAIGDDVRRETAALADAIATFVCERSTTHASCRRCAPFARPAVA